MNIRKHRKLAGKIKTCSILVKNGKYYACFSCEVGVQPRLDTKLISLDKQIGIDVGTSENNFYRLDTGEEERNPYFFQQAEKILGEMTRKLDKKKHRRRKEEEIKSSQKYKKARLQFAKKAEKVSNQRKDFLFKKVK